MYRHDIGVSLKAQGRMLLYGAWYFIIAIPPLVVLIVPCLFLLAQLNARYGYDPLAPGTPAILSVKVEDPRELYRVQLEASEGLDVTPPLRIRDESTVLWRIEPRPGTSVTQGNVKLSLGDSGKLYERSIPLHPSTFAMQTGPRESAFSKPIFVMSSVHWWMQLLYPDFSIRPVADQIAEVAVTFPERKISLFGISTHWIVIFLVLSLVSGLAAAKVLRIEV